MLGTRASLGLSLEDGHLHLVCLRASWGSREVADSASLPLPATPEDEETFHKEVQTFVIRNGLSPADEVVLGPPRRDLLFRVIETPPVKEQDLPEFLSFEADRHLPGQVGEFVTGFQRQGRLAGGGHRILLGALRREVLERALTLLRTVNIRPRSYQPPPVALAALFAVEHPGEPALLVAVESDGFAADLVAGGRLRLTRYFPLAGALDRDNGPGGEETAEGDLDSERRRAGEIAARLESPLFRESLPGAELPPVFLCGPGGADAFLVEKLEQALQVPVRHFFPWQRLQHEGAAAGPLLDATALAAMGLSGGREGLELSSEREESRRERPRWHTTAALALLSLLLAGGIVAGRTVRHRQHLAMIDEETGMLKGQMAEVAEISRSVQEKGAELALLSGTVRGRVRQADLLRELTEIIPEDAYLTEYTFRKGSLQITGLAPSASRLLPILEASPLLEGVEFSAPIVAQGQTLERFKIKMIPEVSGG